MWLNNKTVSSHEKKAKGIVKTRYEQTNEKCEVMASSCHKHERSFLFNIIESLQNASEKHLALHRKKNGRWYEKRNNRIGNACCYQVYGGKKRLYLHGAQL